MYIYCTYFYTSVNYLFSIVQLGGYASWRASTLWNPNTGRLWVMGTRHHAHTTLSRTYSSCCTSPSSTNSGSSRWDGIRCVDISLGFIGYTCMCEIWVYTFHFILTLPLHSFHSWKSFICVNKYNVYWICLEIFCLHPVPVMQFCNKYKKVNEFY